MSILISAILLMLAAAFKAVADTLVHHFDTSVFKYSDPRFWQPDVSCNYVGFIRFTKFRPDAWHLSNSLMILCFVAFGITNPSLAFMDSILLNVAASFCLYGFVFNLTFNLFYNKVLRRK